MKLWAGMTHNDDALGQIKRGPRPDEINVAQSDLIAPRANLPRHRVVGDGQRGIRIGNNGPDRWRDQHREQRDNDRMRIKPKNQRHETPQSHPDRDKAAGISRRPPMLERCTHACGGAKAKQDWQAPWQSAPKPTFRQKFAPFADAPLRGAKNGPLTGRTCAIALAAAETPVTAQKTNWIPRYTGLLASQATVF